jgi:hypothetical protein
MPIGGKSPDRSGGLNGSSLGGGGGRRGGNGGGGGRASTGRAMSDPHGLSGGGTRGGNNAGGMSSTLLDMKYPGARAKKVKQREMTLENMAKVGTIMGGLVGGPVGSIPGMIGAGIDALQGEDVVGNMLDPFSGRGMPDVPSVGAGSAQGSDSDKPAINTVTGLTAAKKKRNTKPSNPLGSVGTILSGVGGSLVAGGL